MNISEFINDLLKSSRYTIYDRERIIQLCVKEVRDNLITKKDILKILNSEINKNGIEFKQGKQRSVHGIDGEKIDCSKYVSPQKMYEFLQAYNQDPILKYTCHNIDDSDVIELINQRCGVDDYDFAKHYAIIKDSYINLENRYKNEYGLKHIKGLIRAYLQLGKEDKTWSTDGIKETWNGSIKEWAQSNPNLIPNPGANIASKQRSRGYILKNSFVSSYSRKKVRQFTDLVIYFKNLFHIRPDNSLKHILEIYNSQMVGRDWIEGIVHLSYEEDFKTNIELFTDVDKLMQAYKKIINMNIECSRVQNNIPADISLSFYEDKKRHSICFCVHHNNSIYQKSIESTVNRLGESTKSIIDNQINGLCNLYLIADFGDGQYAEINLWNGNNRESKLINKVQGVTYKLEFLRP